MSLNEPQITIHGNLTDDPELRFTPNGKAVARFSVAQNPRFRQDGEWKDGTAVFFQCQIWNRPAENVAESLNRGDRVTVTGRIRIQEWDDRETGEKRSRQYIECDDVALSLVMNSAKANRTRRTNGATAQEDPWETMSGNGGNGEQASVESAEPAEAIKPAAKPAARRTRATAKK